MRYFIYIMMLFHFSSVFSQTITSFKPLRYDEDYSFLKYKTTINWYNKTKFTPFTTDKKTYLSLGGEIRYQYFYVKNETWGDDKQDSDGYILTRCLVHADFHVGNRFRTFIQLQSSLANSRPAPSAVDNNPLEVHQAFADYSISSLVKKKLIFRLGRQEMLYGAQRLVSVRDGPNNRQSFDALRSIYTAASVKFDLFYSHYVTARKNLLDDRLNNDVKLWGAYIVKKKLPFFKNADLYYLGVWKRHAVFDEGTGAEIRHSLGSRLWHISGNWKYDLEALYQFGAFAGMDISAWTASLNTSYKFTKIECKPEIGIKAELISGDKEYGDNRLQTFNPLFPRGAYFGLAALIGPANLIDIHPALTINLSTSLSLDFDYDTFWRYSANDALYAINLSMIYSGKNIRDKYIGAQWAGNINYRPNDFIYLRAEFTWFKPGNFIKSGGAGKDIFFSGATVQLKF
jgi:hypothetical protein